MLCGLWVRCGKLVVCLCVCLGGGESEGAECGCGGVGKQGNPPATPPSACYPPHWTVDPVRPPTSSCCFYWPTASRWRPALISPLARVFAHVYVPKPPGQGAGTRAEEVHGEADAYQAERQPEDQWRAAWI